jgi:hypothetical protein
MNSVVEQAIEREVPEVPGPANDPSLGMNDNQDVSNDSEFIEDEDDWEFNEEPPSHDDGQDAAVGLHDDSDDYHDELADQNESFGGDEDDFESIEVEGFDDDADDDSNDYNDNNNQNNNNQNNGEVDSDEYVIQEAGGIGDQSEAAGEYGEEAGLDGGNPAEYGLESDDFSAGIGGQDPEDSGSIDLANDGLIGDSIGVGDPALDPVEMNADDLTPSSMRVDDGLPKAIPVIDEAPSAEQSLSGAREDAFGASKDFSAPPQQESYEDSVPLVGADDQTSEDPENWDFLADQANSSSVGLSSKSMPEQSAMGTSAPGSQARPRPVHDSLSGGPLAGSADRHVGALARIVSALAWVVFFGLMSSGVYLGVMSSVDSGVNTPAFVSIGEMRAANIRGQWLDTTRAGTLYVVTGDLLNPGTQAVALHQAVQVSLLGENGDELEASQAFAGRDVEFDSLREMSIDELWSSQRLTALALASDEIGPGQSASFVATFVSLPEAASHFQLDAVESERINEIAIARGVSIPAPSTTMAVMILDGMELDPNVLEPEAGESGIASELEPETKVIE